MEPTEETEPPEDVLDRVSDGFFAVDSDWQVTYINRAGEEFLDATAEDLVGEVLCESFPGAVGTASYDAYHRAVETGEPVTFESYYPPLESWFEVRVETTDRTVTVRIADDGPGLVPEETAVFDRGEESLDSDGTGLGLYLVDELVSRYGGGVHVSENEPRGTVFSIELNRT